MRAIFEGRIDLSVSTHSSAKKNTRPELAEGRKVRVLPPFDGLRPRFKTEKCGSEAPLQSTNERRMRRIDRTHRLPPGSRFNAHASIEFEAIAAESDPPAAWSFRPIRRFHASLRVLCGAAHQAQSSARIYALPYALQKSASGDVRSLD